MESSIRLEPSVTLELTNNMVTILTTFHGREELIFEVDCDLLIKAIEILKSRKQN